MARLARTIYLASRSPRRRELLAQIGVGYELLLFRAERDGDEDVDESPLAAEAPDAYVLRVCRAKAEAGWRRLIQRHLPPAPVLAADTTVTLASRILGKPADRREAAAMLGELSGKRHEVLTAVAVKLDDQIETALSRSEVRLRELSEPEIRAYLLTGDGDDKAGAYGIQGRFAQFIEEIHGSYTGIVGLPLFETAQLLERFMPRDDRRRR
jgi:septum formation protein